MRLPCKALSPKIPKKYPQRPAHEGAHTAQAAAFFLALAFIARRRLPPRPAAAAMVVALCTVVLVGWSRVHLQVHFLSDVLAGGLLGALIAAAVLRASRRLAATP